MPKNILIFSDGTGQSGGITFDEDRSNIYKLYRATRCGPDSCIHPDEQVAFYDPGLGSPADGGFMFGKIGRWMYNTVSQATGLGITANIIDCYAALIRLYCDGDRVFLFGFSRGAYTVRSLAAVIAKCGVPRHLPGAQPLRLDVAGSRKLATQAVKDVYQFCSSRPRKGPGSYRNFMLDTRSAIAERFRREHGSCDPNNSGKANVYPYFVGVFDTVAALGRPAAVALLIGAAVAIIAVLSFFASQFSGLAQLSYYRWLGLLTFWNIFGTLVGAGLVAGAVAYVRNYLKFDFRAPGYSWLKGLATFHIAPPKHKFTEYSLDPNVDYAKHAISIDEDRKDFKRVPWNPDISRQDTRDQSGNIRFEQVWFAGVHADIGGGYPENESRLSDVTLQWMLAAASILPNGIKHNSEVLRLYPDPTGPQHDECKAGHWQRGTRTLPPADDGGPSRAVMHRSVYARMAAATVVQYDTLSAYRPDNVRNHIDLGSFWTGQPLSQEKWQAFADDVEARWQRRA